MRLKHDQAATFLFRGWYIRWRSIDGLICWLQTSQHVLVPSQKMEMPRRDRWQQSWRRVVSISEELNNDNNEVNTAKSAAQLEASHVSEGESYPFFTDETFSTDELSWWDDLFSTDGVQSTDVLFPNDGHLSRLLEQSQGLLEWTLQSQGQDDVHVAESGVTEYLNWSKYSVSELSSDHGWNSLQSVLGLADYLDRKWGNEGDRDNSSQQVWCREIK